VKKNGSPKEISEAKKTRQMLQKLIVKTFTQIQLEVEIRKFDHNPESGAQDPL